MNRTRKLRSAVVSGLAVLAMAVPVALGAVPAASAKIPIDPAKVIADIAKAASQNAKYEEFTWAEAEVAERDTNYEYNVIVLSISAITQWGAKVDVRGGPDRGQPIYTTVEDNGWKYGVWIFDTGTFDGGGYDYDKDYPAWSRFRGDFGKSGRYNDHYTFRSRPDRGQGNQGDKKALRSRENGLLADDDGARNANGNLVKAERANNNAAQVWSLEAQGGDVYVLKNGATGYSKALDLDTGNGKVQVWTYGGGANQRWKIVGGGPDGTVSIINTQTWGCLSTGSLGQGLSVQPCHDWASQYWYLDGR
ncbi:RICIN domain-containing protein [Actinocrispum wychmicini]|uniref:Ricin-type beta-trefoil lectin protein n=1 Tax=Actinocrispum wychmicini TaxID=1213861 RepID=A0A4R2JSN4_9PSEU|nr:RICIN domain-containing protein [Actinocrispum wychmicini]TCO62117.1 ricin-type beta-trefoil lectin protein [Actinocrispum wychmicini]